MGALYKALLVIWLILIVAAGFLLFSTITQAQAIEPIEPAPDQPVIRYVPADRIEWQCTGSQGDEIITAKEIDADTWEFYITPDPTKLTSAEITEYPWELFRLEYYNDGMSARKVPLNKIFFDFETIPEDSKVLSTELSDYKIDLTTNKGVRLTGNPTMLSGAYLKYGVHSATYSVASNTIIVTGSPVTYQDIYNADVANGWGVFFQLGTQQFHSTAKIQYGDDSTPTLLEDLFVQLSFATNINSVNFQNLQTVETNAIVRLANCSVIDEDDGIRGNYMFTYSGGKIQFTDCQLAKLKESAPDRSGISNFTTGSYIRDSCLNNVYLYFPNHEATNVSISNSLYGIYRPGANAALSDITITNNVDYPAGVGGVTASTFTNCIMSGDITDIYYFVSSATATFINCTLNDWSSAFSAPSVSGALRVHTLDLLVTTESGTPMVALVTIADANGNTVYASATSATGTITTQNLNYGTYAVGTTTAVMQTPHTITISADDYLSYTGLVMMDETKSLEVALIEDSEETISGTIISYLEANMTFLVWALLAMVFTVAFYVSRRGILAIFATTSWLLFGVYCYTQSESTWDLYYSAFFFAESAVFIMLFEVIFHRERKTSDEITDEEEEGGIASIRNTRQRIRELSSYNHEGKRGIVRRKKANRTGSKITKLDEKIGNRNKRKWSF